MMDRERNDYHVPALLDECLEALDLSPDGVYVDVTFGGGGHSRAILSRLGPDGRLFAFDQDADAEANDSQRLGEPLAEAPTYLRAEVAWAVTHEGAEHLEDVLLHRVRLDLSHRDRGLSAAKEILGIMAPLLHWSDNDAAKELASYTERVEQIAAAEAEATDADAVAKVTRPI